MSESDPTNLLESLLLAFRGTGNAAELGRLLDQVAVAPSFPALALPADAWESAGRKLELTKDPRRLVAGVNLGLGLAKHGLEAEAIDLWERCAQKAAEAKQPEVQSLALHTMAEVVHRRGDTDRADELWRQALELIVRERAPQGQSAILSNMGYSALTRGDRQRAEQLYRMAIRVSAGAGLWRDAATGCTNLAYVHREQAGSCLAQATWLATRVDLKWDHAMNFAGILARQQGLQTEIVVPALAFALAEVNRAQGQHSQWEQARGIVLDELRKCALQRGVAEADFETWLVDRGLLSRVEAVEALVPLLEALVPEGEWLFDRSRAPEFRPASSGRA